MSASLENRHYVATDSDIERIVKDHTASVTAQSEVMQTFLNVLIGTTLADLGLEPRKRSTRERNKVEDSKVTRSHLSALQAVYERFYAVLVRALADLPADPESLPKVLVGRRATRKAITQARATKYRSTKHALRAWIKAGFDIACLAPGSVTRSELERDVRSTRSGVAAKAPSSLDRVARRADSAAKRFLALVKEVARFDQDRAAQMIVGAASTLATTRAKMTGHEMPGNTTSLKKAVEEGAPLDFGKETFIILPYATQQRLAA